MFSGTEKVTPHGVTTNGGDIDEQAEFGGENGGNDPVIGVYFRAIGHRPVKPREYQRQIGEFERCRNVLMSSWSVQDLVDFERLDAVRSAGPLRQ